MSLIALADFEGALGTKLGHEMAESLRLRRHSVSIFQGGPSIVKTFNDLGAVPDVLYWYVQAPDGRAEIYLDQLQRFWREHGPRPLVQCILERYFGARYQLALEKRWARVAYIPTNSENRN